MYQLTDVHHALHRLTGTWEGLERLFASPWAAESSATGRVIFRPILGGTALLQEYQQTRAEGSLFELYGIWTVEIGTDTVLWHSFDSFVPTPEQPARGHWENDVLTMEKVTSRGKARHYLSTKGNTLDHSIATVSLNDEEFQPFMETSYSRIS